MRMRSGDALASKTEPGPWKRIDTICCIFLMLAAVLVTVVHVPSHTQISPIDEFVYIDYLAKVPDQPFVAQGEETGDFARRYFACAGVGGYFAPNKELCEGGDYSNDSEFPFGGKTSADIYTPAYFYVTWALAQPLKMIGFDTVDAGRFTGSVWLTAALVALFAAVRRLRVDRWINVSIGLFLAGSLPVYWSNTFISTDATALLAGAGLLWLGIRAVQTKSHVVALPVFAVLVTLMKLQNFMAVACVALFLLLAAIADVQKEKQRDTNSIRQWATHPLTQLGVATGILPLIAQALWTVYRSSQALSSTPDQQVGQPMSMGALMMDGLRFLPNVLSGAASPQELGTRAAIIASLGTMLITAGVIALAVRGRKDEEGTLIAKATVITSLVGAPALAIASLLVSGVYFSMPARYALSLVPFALACVALLFNNTRYRWLLVAIGAGAFLVSLTI